jgi:hypothetical protein
VRTVKGSKCVSGITEKETVETTSSNTTPESPSAGYLWFGEWFRSVTGKHGDGKSRGHDSKCLNTHLRLG